MIATISTAVFIGVIVIAAVNSPGWARVRESFFDGEAFAESFPDIVSGFWVNVQMFLIAEALVLVFALLIAVLRSIPGPVFFPLRLVAVAYTDLFRGIPTLLVIFLLGFGMPALRLQGLPTSEMFWGVVALVLVYSAYVAEVYRAGIESVHPSQRAAARSLGLGQWQAMRFVILPQAVRRVIPPLLNDFVGLQKETALVAVLGVREAVREAGIYSTSTFDYTSYLGASILFIVVTIPLARFTDHLIARGRRRREATGG
ncbi:MAG TPA: amino acid ABC transporter permease [Actinomycetota bacterium]|nr:amino acid ABC transporter permease [Actinomycetota bacterium]